MLQIAPNLKLLQLSTYLLHPLCFSPLVDVGECFFHSCGDFLRYKQALEFNFALPLQSLGREKCGRASCEQFPDGGVNT